MSNKFLKKEYLIPLAIIIGTVIIGLSIYLGTTLEYRENKAYCEKFIKSVTPKFEKDEPEANILFVEMSIQRCIKQQFQTQK